MKKAKPTGGTFVLNIGRRKTKPIKFDATHAEIQGAVDALAKRIGVTRIRIAK